MGGRSGFPPIDNLAPLFGFLQIVTHLVRVMNSHSKKSLLQLGVDYLLFRLENGCGQRRKTSAMDSQTLITGMDIY
jgi:hypothetical protein